MRGEYFIMMNQPSGTGVTPLVSGDASGNEEVMLFDSLDEARTCAKSHSFCEALGYEIFHRGEGVS